jgi:integrase
MTNKPLTDIAIRNLKPRAKRYEVPDRGARGLYVQVLPTGTRSYVLRYRRASDGRTRKLTLPPGIPLAAARKLAAEAMFKVAQGLDPAAEKRTVVRQEPADGGSTLRAICEEYLARPAHRKLRSIGERERMLARLVYPVLGNRPIDAIKRSEIARLLDKIEDERGPSMAHETLAVVRKIMNWHASRSDDFRSPIVRGMGRISPKERARSRILSDDELRAIWKATETGDPFSALVRFLLLTGARRLEGAQLHRREIEGGDWTLPVARNKAKVDLIRPLSPAAQEVLASLPVLDGYVFSVDGRRPISSFSRSKRQFDAACGVTGWTLHDLRRSARSLMSRAGVQSDHAERCLGHAIPGIRGTYDRHEYREEKKHAYEALAALIDRIVNPPAADNVLQMRR